MQAPTALLSGRYRFKSRLDAGTKAPTWLAVDEKSGKEVVASALATARVAALIGVVGLRHPHLAGIVEVVDAPEADALPPGSPAGAAVVVGEHVSGKTLHQALKTARLTPAEAVTLWIRLCQGVAALHASGGAHGAISPRSIVVEPTGGRQAPILTQLLAPTSGAYCAPERLQGRGPSAADDAWALHAVLFSALTGSPPFRGDTKDQLLMSIAGGQLQRLSDYGLRDDGLQELLATGLVANLARRRASIDQLIEALERWEPKSEAASEWEDVATVVASSSEHMAQAMRQEVEAPKVPAFSIPPVPIAEEERAAPEVAAEPQPEPAHEPAPVRPGPAPVRSPFDDEDDATTVMGKPPIEDIRAALAPSEPPALDLPVAPPKPPPRVPAAPPSPFDATPPPPQAMPMAAPVAPTPAPGAGFPPPLSAFPPSIPAPPPTGVQLPLDDVEIRNAGRKPIFVLVAIVVLLAIGIGVLLFLNNRGVITRRQAEPPAAAPARVAATSSASPGQAPATAVLPAPSASAVVPAAVSVRTEDRGRCVAAHFEGETFRGDEDFSFLCGDQDFRGINSQLHRKLVVSGAGKITPGMKEWSNFGWFELAASAVVRSGCCGANAEKPRLPATGGDCPELSAALTALAARPLASASVAERVASYEEAVLCLYRKGVPRPYNYSGRPTAHARVVFTGFLERAAARS